MYAGLWITDHKIHAEEALCIAPFTHTHKNNITWSL